MEGTRTNCARCAELAELSGQVERMRAELQGLRRVAVAASNLVRVKGRFHTEQAFRALSAELATVEEEGKGAAIVAERLNEQSKGNKR